MLILLPLIPTTTITPIEPALSPRRCLIVSLLLLAILLLHLLLFLLCRCCHGFLSSCIFSVF